MCAPAEEKNMNDLYKRVLNYAKGFKKFEGKDEEQIIEEMKGFEQTSMQSLKDL
jgi:carboxylesterase